jgi:nitrite reductase/ring-hydroxylating ferredoxin subunit
MPKLRVAGAALLEEGKTQIFPVEEGKNAKDGFVIKYEGQLLAFLNECPHWSVDLDLGDEHFFDEEMRRVYCKNHGALFVLPSGECETGPCLGRSLTRYDAVVDGADVVVSV